MTYLRWVFSLVCLFLAAASSQAQAQSDWGVVVNGRVDRLVVGESEVMIVDFKTDRPPPKAAEKVDSVYLEQMAAYRALLRALYPKKRVRAALLWTDGPRLMELPEALLDGALRTA